MWHMGRGQPNPLGTMKSNLLKWSRYVLSQLFFYVVIVREPSAGSRSHIVAGGGGGIPVLVDKIMLTLIVVFNGANGLRIVYEEGLSGGNALSSVGVDLH